MVDKQNINARFIDKFSSGVPSTKTLNPPGGKSSFSLGWGDTDKVDDYKKNNNYKVYKNESSDIFNQKESKNVNNNNSNVEKTSVRVKQAPGGTSQIKFG